MILFGEHSADCGPGDGTLSLRFNDGDTFALFIHFLVQSTETDDATGAPLSQHFAFVAAAGIARAPCVSG